MARLQNTINYEFKSWSTQHLTNTPQIDPSYGGQFGYQPHWRAYVSNAGYTPRPVIALLLERPRGFDFLPDPQKSTQVLKSLIETQSKTITGLRTGLTVESTERPIGAGGHQQRDPNNVTEEISEPEHTWDERYGRSIHNFWQWYIRNLIMEPITKQPGLMNIQVTEPPPDNLPDMYSFTTLYIEPDPLRRFVTEAWLCTNMYPQSSGTLESQYDPTTGQDVPELSITFHAIPVVSVGIRAFAQSILDQINYEGAGPMQRPSWVDGVDPSIAAAEQGYLSGIDANMQIGTRSTAEGGTMESIIDTTRNVATAAATSANALESADRAASAISDVF